MRTEGGDELNERSSHLLRVLVESYIRDGEPVGSRTLSRESGLTISSATIRNVMADLEDLGFVASPHTSAGRVPTDKGYRFFVDALMRHGGGAAMAESAPEAAELERRLQPGLDAPKSLVVTASQMLSHLTHMAGLVTLPRPAHMAVSQIEFLPLSENRVLAILVVNGTEVQNRILQVERRFSPEELRRAAGWLNEQFRGREVHHVRESLLRELQDTRSTMNQMMQDAISMAQQVFQPARSAMPEVDMLVAGETNLMGYGGLSNVDRLRRLFEAFNEKRDLLHLLDQCVHAEGVQIFIGQESGYGLLDDLSLVTAPYAVDDQVVGVLGVIGPTRMAYERVIPIVDITAKLLSSALRGV